MMRKAGRLKEGLTREEKMEETQLNPAYEDEA